jgi:hypothetical protein
MYQHNASELLRDSDYKAIGNPSRGGNGRLGGELTDGHKKNALRAGGSWWVMLQLEADGFGGGGRFCGPEARRLLRVFKIVTRPVWSEARRAGGHRKLVGGEV